MSATDPGDGTARSGRNLSTGSPSDSTPSSSSAMAPAAAMGLVSEAMRRMASRRSGAGIVERRVPEHFRVHVTSARDERHQSRHGAALDVRGETIVQPLEPGEIESGRTGHGRARGGRRAMRWDASGRVRAWRR